MQAKETKWTPMKALGKAQKEIDALGVPIFKADLEEKEELKFPNLSQYDNKELEDFLTMYGGYKAYLETKVADIEATVGAFEAAFTEGYNTALYRLINEYEENNKKKPTKEELRGEILSKFISLKEQKQELIDQQTILKRVAGLLNAYTQAYNTVSRVVALRTYGQQ